MKARRRYVPRTPRGKPVTHVAETPGQRELLAVREIVHAFLHADRPEEAFQFALDRVAPVVGASFASVYLMDGASELMRLTAAHNWPEQHRPWLAEMRVRVGFGPSGEAASERRVIEVPDVFADSDLEDWQDVARELGFAAIVSLPLQSASAVLGAVTFYFRAWDDFTSERRGLLRLMADVMAGAAEKSLLLDQVRRSDAAVADAHGDLDRQALVVSDTRRAAREFALSAADALHPALAAFRADDPALAVARRLVDDIVLMADLEAGVVEATSEAFDPRTPLRDAMRAVPVADSPVHPVAEEPIHALPAARGDREKLARTLATLIVRALRAATVGEVRVTVAALGDRVEYRVPGSAGNDMAWRLADGLVRLMGGGLEEESGVAGPVLVCWIPAERDGNTET